MASAPSWISKNHITPTAARDALALGAELIGLALDTREEFQVRGGGRAGLERKHGFAGDL